MNPFNRRVAWRIAAVSAMLACLASSLTWLVARESAEAGAVSLAMEESRRLLENFHASEGDGVDARTKAGRAAQFVIGGLFDIAEIYDAQGEKLAEAMTEAGQAVESRLPAHRRPNYHDASYDSLIHADQRWILRIFIPLQRPRSSQIMGYFEGVRVVPEWQRREIRQRALVAALMAALASLLCGAAIYPVVVRLSADNERKARELLNAHLAMMEALGRAIAKRDSDTGGHNFRVAWIAARIGEAMGLRGHAMQTLIVGSFLHDVGKIGIPDAILLKPGRLDAAEMNVMRTHVRLGEEIVGGIGWLDDAAHVVAGHHEKWDGSGYPRGLSGEEIPLAARIFAVADVFDALCSRRPYKEAMGFAAAMEILERDSGRHFDPGVVQVFRGMAPVIYQRLQNTDEVQTRQLLHERIHHHFAL